MNVIYHQNREVILDLEPGATANNRNQKVPLVTQEALSDFYSSKVKLFQNLGRELEVDEEPEAMFPGHQTDMSTCSEAEIRIHQQILQSVSQAKKEKEIQWKNNPIHFRYIRESTIFFNSRFESGNLREAERLQEFEYNLYLNFDFNTLNYTQWYYFSVRNIKKGYTYKFNIMNLQKDESSYNQGMKPFIYSTKKNKEEGTNLWQRGGDNVEYYKNNLKSKNRESAPDYEYDEASIPFYVYEDLEAQTFLLNTLTFTYTFEYDEDIVFFSYFQPYTHNDLKDYIFSLTKKYSSEHLKNNFKNQRLCHTIEGNVCHMLTITDNIQLEQSQLGYQVGGKEPKQVVYLTARVHPGESNSSYMIQGCIDLLMAQNKDAQNLREQFIFKIIPMLNPDGVIRGNYRCNSLGVDLNRRWQNPSKLLHPTVYYAKQAAKQITKDGQIVLFCDMHGHSRKRNVFMYGCVCPQNDLLQHRNNNLIKLIPYMLSQKNKLFSFPDCKFANEKDKESTARIVMFREFSVINSYTLESTFYAQYNKETFKRKRDVDNDLQLKGDDLLQIGNDLCLSLAHILYSKILKKKFLEQKENNNNQLQLVNQTQGTTAANPLLQTPVQQQSIPFKEVSSNGLINQAAIQKERSTGREGQSQYVSQIRDQSLNQSMVQSSIVKQNKEQNSIGYHASSVGLVDMQSQQNQAMNQSVSQFQQLNYLVKHQNSLPTQPEFYPAMLPNSNLSLKKRSERTLIKEQNQVIQSVQQSQVQQEFQTPAKRKASQNTNYVANGVLQNPSVTQSPFQVGAGQGTSNQKVIVRSSIMKQNIIEPPNQVNAVLVNHFVHLSRGAKNTQQDLFKLHNQNNFKGIVTQLANSAAKPVTGTQFSPDKRNSSYHLASSSKIVNNNQNQYFKSQSVRATASQPPGQNQSNMLLSTLLTGNIQPQSLPNSNAFNQPSNQTATFSHFHDQMMNHHGQQNLVMVSVPQYLDKLPSIIQKQIQKQQLVVQETETESPSKRPMTTTQLKMQDIALSQTATAAQKYGNQVHLTKDYPQPQVLRQTMMVFHPNARIEYYNSSESTAVQPIPKMGNAIIQKALEQSQQNQQAQLIQQQQNAIQVLPNALYTKRQQYSGNPVPGNQLVNQR